MPLSPPTASTRPSTKRPWYDSAITPTSSICPCNSASSTLITVYLVGNVLDLGPAGIEVPQVEEEATVDEAVKYFYYPQQGKRSWGGVARWKIDGNDDRLAYADW